jgi:hypothetical protein
LGVIDVPEVHPSSAVDWFTLLQDNRLLGLVLFDLVDLLNYALLGLILLALYAALRRTNRSAMAIATTMGLVGVAVHLASNQVISMLNLSHKYAAATTDAQRGALLAAGEALLAIHNPGAIHQGTGMYVGLFLVLLAGLIISLVMLRSRMPNGAGCPNGAYVFSKVTAWVGILANGLALGHFVALAFAPAIGPTPVVFGLPMAISAPFRVTWYVLIAIRLFQLAWGRSKEKEGRDAG